ncbi:polysaccharide deacetylase family protein [Brevibacillus ruminantium]|uniref:Polysaccharide deacetylase family protein n=1 Tax=Brevibacillus ruminantium TaxID=2950604 RepID=A0ABY4WMU2_9BACL|nr:polysaccharide deacetylase family protein [Brevibacillus ruminantium]USG67135.1 polysaccharide deacetylase family protein [Brevibacillus ruminantium]
MALLKIAHPPGWRRERAYIFDVLLSHFLGIDYEAEVELRTDIRISAVGGEEESELILSDCFFQQDDGCWLTPQSLPPQPLAKWDLSALGSDAPLRDLLVEEELPIIWGAPLENGEYLVRNDSGIRLGVDIFGSSFFMLTRYEEAVKPDRDRHDRFPAIASLAYQEGFLDRPIVNEYLELLWWCLKALWPGLERKQHRFQMRISHDVDWPLGMAYIPITAVLRKAVGDVWRRHNLGLAMRRVQSLIKVKRGDLDADLYNTFDWIMNVCERQGLQTAFYFIAGHTAGQIDGLYHLEDEWIRKLLRRVHERGHEIGLHPSYHTYRDPAALNHEFQRLLATLEDEGIVQQRIGGRQHYLRWENPTTWGLWAEAGLSYDSTLGYADHAGFRCGVCYDYPVYHLQTRQALQLVEQPLIVMEITVLEKIYMNLSREKAREEIEKLKARCRKYNGNFTLLWHNNVLIHPLDAELFQVILQN